MIDIIKVCMFFGVVFAVVFVLFSSFFFSLSPFKVSRTVIV